jgi:cytoskeletal protein CcmA (bactofilin family)
MSVFSSAKSGDRSPIATIGPSTQLSIVANGTRIIGEVECEGILKIEGRVEGVVRGHEQVVIAPGGIVMGDVRGDEIIIAGRVEGDVGAAVRIELRAGGAVHGDVTAPRIAVQEGGELNGRIQMEKPAATRTVSAEQLKKSA